MTGIMSENPPPSADVITAVATNRAGTIAVRATERAIPVDLRISPNELRYGGARLAEQILVLATKAGAEAGVRRRLDLEACGVPEAILDRLGLPTRDQLAETVAATDQTPPSSWMRSI